MIGARQGSYPTIEAGRLDAAGEDARTPQQTIVSTAGTLASAQCLDAELVIRDSRIPNKATNAQHGPFLVYQNQDGKLKIDVRFEGETVWLTQQQMAELFQTSVPNVSMHIKNVFEEGELEPDSVVKESLTTAADGKNYSTKFYNLDVIISVGYLGQGFSCQGFLDSCRDEAQARKELTYAIRTSFSNNPSSAAFGFS